MPLIKFRDVSVQCLTPPITLSHSPNVSDYKMQPCIPERLLFFGMLHPEGGRTIPFRNVVRYLAAGTS